VTGLHLCHVDELDFSDVISVHSGGFHQHLETLLQAALSRNLCTLQIVIIVVSPDAQLAAFDQFSALCTALGRSSGRNGLTKLSVGLIYPTTFF